MSNNPLPIEFLQQQVVHFREPRVIIDVTHPDVHLPAPMRELAQDGKLALGLDARMLAVLRMCPEDDGGGFELMGRVENARIPGAAILAVMDGATGETMTPYLDLLEAPQ